MRTHIYFAALFVTVAPQVWSVMDVMKQGVAKRLTRLDRLDGLLLTVVIVQVVQRKVTSRGSQSDFKPDHHHEFARVDASMTNR